MKGTTKRIAICAPAAPLHRELADRVEALAKAEFPGLELRFHSQCFLEDGHFAGSDAVRLEALIDCANDLPSVSMEEASLDAIVTALIENSRQAGASRIAFHIEAKGGLIRLSAKDDGIGIPAADRNRVFEPFFTTKRASGGSGLGLPIVKSLVEAAGGGLRLEDSEAGAQFSLDLPIA